MLQITFKYDIGDEVWLMTGNGVTAKPCKAKIGAVNYTKSDFVPKGYITYKYHLFKNYAYDMDSHDTCNESFIFATKEELLASL